MDADPRYTYAALTEPLRDPLGTLPLVWDSSQPIVNSASDLAFAPGNLLSDGYLASRVDFGQDTIFDTQARSASAFDNEAYRASHVYQVQDTFWNPSEASLEYPWNSDTLTSSGGLCGRSALTGYMYEAASDENVGTSSSVAVLPTAPEAASLPTGTSNLGSSEDYSGLPFTCVECNFGTKSHLKLNDHASETGHCPYECEEDGCESVFSRFGDMKRHRLSHQSDIPGYPCMLCRRHRGSDGFRRKDHLTQHQRGFHSVDPGPGRYKYYNNSRCPHKDCPLHGEGESPWNSRYWPFPKQSDYTKHMKVVHDESPFPCHEPGCPRVGGKGYYSKKALRKHELKEHGVKLTA